jgi:rRNA maturation RNase YbeY
MAIQFYFNEVKGSLKEKRRLKNFISQLFLRFNKRLHKLTVVFCSDEYLLTINQDFLNHDYYTDIITFNLSNDTENTIEGELYISYDRIRDNASTLSISGEMEMHRVIFHGILHLCGYSDKSRKDKAEMTRMENDTLSEYFGTKQ